MFRSIVVVALLAMAVATSAVAAGGPSFQPDPGIVSLDSGATGVYELGRVRFGDESGRLLALVHHGRVLQVHFRHDGRWLAQRSGSSGGKAVAPTKFDELAAIAGGVNQDVRQAPAATQERFARAAGLVFFDDAAAATGPGAASRGPAGRQLQLDATASAAACGSVGCRAIYRHGTTSAEHFVVSADPEDGLWGFEGYGIVAIWPVPQAD